MRFTRLKVLSVAAVLAAVAFVCWPVPAPPKPTPFPVAQSVDLSPRVHLLDRVMGILHAQGLSNANPYNYWVPPGACQGSTAGTLGGTNGLTTAGASLTAVSQVSTTAAGGPNTHTFVCNITPPSVIVTSGTGLQVLSADFMYGIQTTNLGTQACVPASGTWNGAIVFSTITYPTPVAGETPSTVTPVRADSGTATNLPVCGSANITTTTAGAFVSQRFTPATGTLPFATDLKQLLLTVALLNTTTSATITNTPGVLVRYQSQ
jgi:hypothetical protein